MPSIPMRAAIAALRHACAVAELLLDTEPEAARAALVAAVRAVIRGL